MEHTNGGSLKLGSMLSFCIGVRKKSCSESVYEVLPPEEKGSSNLASKALGKRIHPAKSETFSFAQLLGRRQRTGESVDDYVREFEQLLESTMDTGLM